MHWVFLLEDKVSGKIIAKWQAPDHPCYGNSGDPDKLPHPFIFCGVNEYNIIVINPTETEVSDIKKRAKETGKDFLDYITKENLEDITELNQWPKTPITIGYDEHENVFIKKKIKKPEYVKHYRLKSVIITADLNNKI